MQVIIDVAKNKEMQVAKLLAMQKAKVDSDKQQLRQLQEYASQYESERNLLGLNANLIANYQHFVTRLGQAIQQQNNVIIQSELQANLAMKQWLSAKAKTQSMNSLQNKHLQQEQKVEDRQEQKQSDEFSIRSYLNKNI